ncbi:hypothetical protein HMPREF9439_00280 [Parasutterella excrementihominis YIT 11859]|uniref:Uncharacterized protein n=1 Tax=Parasutterella excrementihominis YIT 11859 TaxID=762966 RepID=F3QH88_9BURK|nr:hypothetical protein HMPREF9439_00280 [Parasutterella excrementihominis YIT 11859]
MKTRRLCSNDVKTMKNHLNMQIIACDFICVYLHTSNILRKFSVKTDFLQNFCVHRSKLLIPWILLFLIDLSQS